MFRGAPALLLVLTLLIAMLNAPQSGAQSQATEPRQPRMPMSFPAAQFYAAHPDALAQLQAQLPQRPPDPATATANRFRPSAEIGGSWQAVATAPAAALCNPLFSRMAASWLRNAIRQTGTS